MNILPNLLMIRTKAILLTLFTLSVCLLYGDSRPIFPFQSSGGKGEPIPLLLINTQLHALRLNVGVGIAEQIDLQKRFHPSFVGLIGRTEFEDDVTVAPESETSDTSNEQENLNESEEKASNGLQVMITQKMKRILVDELKYLPNEVFAE